jgi:hypothetical protein
MNKFQALACSFLVAFTGCIDDSVGNLASVSGTVATPSKDSAATELANAQIAFNPVITIDASGTSCTYDNTKNTVSSFPAGTTTCTIVYSEGGGALVATLIETNGTVLGGNDLVLNLSGFVDKGNEGLVDEFTVQATHGATTVQETGQFVGATKPLNKTVAATRAELPDLTGAPDAAEWSRYCIGNAISIEESGTGDLSLSRFTSSTAHEGYDVSGSDAGSSWSGTYTYTKNSETTATLVLTENVTIATGAQVTSVTTVELTFTDFYTGSWQTTSSVETIVATGQSTTDTELETGTFQMYTDISLFVGSGSQ